MKGKKWPVILDNRNNCNYHVTLYHQTFEINQQLKISANEKKTENWKKSKIETIGEQKSDVIRTKKKVRAEGSVRIIDPRIGRRGLSSGRQSARDGTENRSLINEKGQCWSMPKGFACENATLRLLLINCTGQPAQRTMPCHINIFLT